MQLPGIKDNHPAIIEREVWEAVQLEIERREKFRHEHGLKASGSPKTIRSSQKCSAGAAAGNMLVIITKGSGKCTGAVRNANLIA